MPRLRTFAILLFVVCLPLDADSSGADAERPVRILWAGSGSIDCHDPPAAALPKWMKRRVLTARPQTIDMETAAHLQRAARDEYQRVQKELAKAMDHAPPLHEPFWLLIENRRTQT